MKYKVQKTDAEWRSLLSPEAYRVLREKGTERAFTGTYTDTETAGTYSCGACDFELFDSTQKFHSGCGWPSFWSELESAKIEQIADNSFGMRRVELVCSNCGSHLGHVFNDGPPPTGQRYCINSISMKFNPQQETKVHVIDLNFRGVPKAIAAFLVETSEGPILIETGPHSTLPYLKAGIEKAGFKMEDIQHVFLTHVHLDHAGAAWVFANHGAKIYVHPLGLPHLADPSRLMASAKRIYQDQMDALWGQMETINSDQLIAIDDDSDYILIGDTTIKGYYTPGHAVHHLAWQVNKSLFGGDVTGVKIGDGILVPPCPPPDINVPDWQLSIAKIRNLDISEIYLTHFGLVTDIQNHLTNLETVLLEWSEWMKPHFEAGTTPEEIIPVFEAYVNEALRKNGADELGIQQYNLANPAWMSVTGLLRYWKKQTAK